MSTRYDITLPTGKKMPVFWEAGQSKMEIVRDMLQPRWEAYCLSHWMGSNESSVAENNIKRYLDGCAYILLRDDPGDTLTDYKDIIIGSKELNVSSCPAYIADVIDGGGATLSMSDTDEELRFHTLQDKLDERARPYQKQPTKPSKSKQDTRFDRLARIRKTYPGCEISLPLPVDTLGVFEYRGIRYQIDARCEQYAARMTTEGEQYDMDRITVVVLADGTEQYYDHGIQPLESEMVNRI